MLALRPQPQSRLRQPQGSTPTWRVVKLGGTTVASPNAVQAACAHVRQVAKRKRVAVVVSALAGVTDLLERLVAEAEDPASDPAGRRDSLTALEARHLDHLEALAASCDASETDHVLRIRPRIEQAFRSLAGLLAVMRVATRRTPELRQLALSLGERLSAHIVRAVLAGSRAELLDSSSLLVAEGDAAAAIPDVEASRRRVRGRLATCHAPIWVVPGFFAHDAQLRLRLLGRGGSDTSATLLGAALGAERVEIWTDVDGIYDADPRQQASARRFPTLDYEGAERMAMSGARVLHTRSIAPARSARIPILVRNSFRPERPGTWIGEARQEVAA
ncbi:MAG: aspartate kinase [Thermoanaerobaculia bacterium]|nr:aspartate kinase [Thermoanaerobaculia bacterium]